jgi:para-nitrobenzyl esterase
MQSAGWVGRRVAALLLATAIVALGTVPVQAQTEEARLAGGLPTITAVDGGIIAGSVADGVLAFKGIPYAAPPVGALRWRAPQPVVAWQGTRPATAFGPDCAQAPSTIEPLQTIPAEDCLSVNVWRPAEARSSAQLPVLVWLHGGGFVGGGTSIPWYDGSAFARQGIVVVSVNYRLGRLGFFAHPALLNANEGPVGNFGFMDQIAALEWVQRNAPAFGGDPGNVTLVGESAGGAAVLALLTSPAATGLFQRAMVMSGGGRNGLVLRQMTGGTPERPSADQIDAAFAQSLGVTGDGPEALAALRALPAATVQGDYTLERLAVEALLGQQIYQGTQMIDGVTVIDHPGRLLRDGQVPPMPLLIGSTADELPLFLPPRTDPFSYFGDDAEAARVAYNAPPTLDRESLIALLVQIGMDTTMNEPARFAAKQMTARGNAAWLYRFTYTAEATRPALLRQAHAGELPFMFDQLAARYGAAVTTNDEQTANAFNSYVANYAKTGDPNGAGLPVWPRFDPARFELLNFSLDDGPVYGPDPRAARVELVERAADLRGQP